MSLVALTACATPPATLTPEGGRVQMVEDDAELVGCEEMAPITGSEEQLRSANARAMVDLRNRTGARGGNRLVPGRPQSYGRIEFRVFHCP